MRAVRVELAQSARDDLAEVIAWYVSREVPDVGVRLVTEIRDRLYQLASFPESGKVVPEFDMPWLRELEHPPFRVVYRYDGDAVTVVRVWRSERLMGDELPDNA